MPLAAQLPGGFFSEENGKDVPAPFGLENPEGAGTVWVDEAASTNELMRQMGAGGVMSGMAVAARRQTDGRGQRGNHWEAEAGKNLTFSVLLRPRNLLPRQQFALSEAVALAVADVLRRYVPRPQEVSVKWPNDVYVGDRKICGILIEHVLQGSGPIAQTIVGVGVNVNQRRFLSDAPNPVSLWQLTGEELLLEPLLDEFVAEILVRCRMADADQGGCPQWLHDHYRRSLWHGQGLHRFRRAADGVEFEARVASVAPTGHLTLSLADGTEQTFAFKEVEQLI